MSDNPTVEYDGTELDAQDLLDAAKVVERDPDGHGAAHRGDVIVMDDGVGDPDVWVGKLDVGALGLYEVDKVVADAQEALEPMLEDLYFEDISPPRLATDTEVRGDTLYVEPANATCTWNQWEIEAIQDHENWRIVSWDEGEHGTRIGLERTGAPEVLPVAPFSTTDTNRLREQTKTGDDDRFACVVTDRRGYLVPLSEEAAEADDFTKYGLWELSEDNRGDEYEQVVAQLGDQLRY